MTRNRFQWHGVRNAVLQSGLFALLGVGLAVGSQVFRDTMQTDLQTHQRRFTHFSHLYLNVDVEALTIKEHYPRFVALNERGVIGQERRLSWIETLEAAGQELKHSRVTYQIASRRPVIAEHSLPRGGFELYATPMHIALELRTEMDLKRLFDHLDEHAQGLYTVTRCAMQRHTKGDQSDAYGPRISAECDLLWYSIIPGDEAGIGL